MNNIELRPILVEKIKKLDKSDIADISHLLLDLLLDEGFPEETLQEEDKHFLCVGIADLILGD